MKRKSTRRIYISGILAFLIYGSWAAYANSDYGFLISLRSFLAQGLLSLFVTMVMTFGMEAVFSRVKWLFCRFILTAFGPLLLLLGFMIFVHWLIDTPHILKTVAPSAIVGTLYCVIYTIGLSKVSGEIKKRRPIFFLLSLLLTLLIFLVIILFITQRIIRTQTHGIIYVKGLHGPVFIYRDHYGIPHILAKTNDKDAFFALGFVQAQDRLWQMEFQRHVVTGTLSEIFGKKTIAQDEFLRTWGFYRAAKAAWPALDANSQAIIKSYTAGVNSEINNGHLPVQILLLHYHPKPWTVYDSIAWQKMMAWQLQTSWQQKIKNYIIAKHEGVNKIPYFMPPYPSSAPTTLSTQDLIQSHLITPRDIPRKNNEEKSLSLSLTKSLKIAQNLHKELGYLDFPGKGSNAWVVSGKFTQSGMPLLANDVHLQLTAPSLWYLVEMKGPHLHIIGASIPGLPCVVIGHNDHIAWGVTDGYNDAQDLFIIPPGEKTKTINETINVKGSKPIHFTVHISSRGPIISDVTPNMKELPVKLAIQWPALEPGDTTIQSFLKLQYAKNWPDFENSLRDFVSPTQNFIYADTAGNIGYYYPGKLPIRAGFSGELPVNNKDHWDGYIPFDQLPHVYNPKEGFIATANNKVASNAYPYSLTFRWSTPPYRIERIQDLLKNGGTLNTKKFKEFQHDTVSYFWKDLKPELIKTKPLDQSSKEALIILQHWDGNFSLTSRGATIFAYWLQQFHALWPKSLAFGDKWLEPLHLKEIFSNDKMQPYLSKSLAQAMSELITAQGNNPNNWQWKKTHKAVFHELGLGQSKLVGWLWKRAISTPGGDYTVDVGTYDPNSFVQIAGATYRQIINLGNLNRSYYIQTLGESENFFSRYYSNFLKMWRNGNYAQMKQYDSPCNPKASNCIELLPLHSEK